MYNFPIGVLVDSYKLELHEALKKASDAGITGVQIYATSGKMSPENLTVSRRKEILDMVNSYGLVISALCGDLGHGFHVSNKNEELIEKSKRILDLAKDLNTNIVTTHIGVVPCEVNDTYKIIQQACKQLADYADELSAHFAVETGPETAVVLKGFLDSLQSRGVAVNLDPANFVMVTGDNPAKAVHTLKDYIVHTHAKDGKKLINGNPLEIYGIIEKTIKDAKYFEELPLGCGDVNWQEYLFALEEVGYKGFLTIERECGDNPEADINTAVKFLKNIIN